MEAIQQYKDEISKLSEQDLCAKISSCFERVSLEP